jgi:hypothetical protein
MTFSTAVPFKLPGGERVSFTATFSVSSSAHAIFTIIAVFLLTSRCRLLADRKDVICSRILSWIFGVCNGKHIANSLSAALTTSVAGGSGSSVASFRAPEYKEIESCSRAPHIGESSYCASVGSILRGVHTHGAINYCFWPMSGNPVMLRVTLMLSWQRLDIISSDQTIHTEAVIVCNFPYTFEAACRTCDSSAERA